MAITIQQQPEAYCLAGNDIFFVATSSNIAEDNFKFVFDLYYDATFQKRMLVVPRPDVSTGIFNAKNIIKSLVTYDFDYADTTFTENANSFKSFYVKIGEQYDVAGVPTTYADLATSNTIVAWNGGISMLDAINFDYTDFNITATASTTKRFLTNAPTLRYIQATQKGWLHFINAPASGVTSLHITTYDSSNSTATYTLTNGLSNKKFIRVPIGTTELTSGASAVFTDIRKYVVKLINGSNQAISESFTFNIETECKYETKRLHWLNELGGIDSFNFNLVSRRSVKGEKKTFERNPYTADATSIEFNPMSRGKSTYYSRSKDTLKLTSDWLTTAESEWLRDLFESPEVYIEQDGMLLPVTINQTDYQIKETTIDKVFNLEFDIEYSYDKTRL